MRNIRLLIEYEGTNYCGWQEQERVPTVQGTLRVAIKKLTQEDVQLFGASRTDAGVHALGQVANFHTASNVPCQRFLHGLNFMLPGDITVKDAADAPIEFDSRKDSIGKTYLYKLLNRPYPSALLHRYSWHVRRPLDVVLIREASAHFIGEKNFASFMAAGSDALHSIREVTGITIAEKGDGLIEIEFKGAAFLRHMVRIMTGTLVAAGKGKIKPSDIPAIIEARDRTAAFTTAPPEGLFLASVEY
ncbi:MAG: tRNA pseudouridine(38-40) synthase TruA [Deltaproteobacteria bacterium]|nr:tRNA pseudouridine(38-40) synthase TruA [Deltaproteobacteria bacterium]